MCDLLNELLAEEEEAAYELSRMEMLVDSLTDEQKRLMVYLAKAIEIIPDAEERLDEMVECLPLSEVDDGLPYLTTFNPEDDAELDFE